MSQLNPFEFTIYSFLKGDPEVRYTHNEIAKKCNINTRTAQKYSEQLVKRKLIKSEKDRGKTTLYYYEEE